MGRFFIGGMRYRVEGVRTDTRKNLYDLQQHLNPLAPYLTPNKKRLLFSEQPAYIKS